VAAYFVQTVIQQFDALGVYDTCRPLAASLATRSADFEKVVEVCLKTDCNAEAPLLVVVVEEADALIASCLEKQFGAFHGDDIAWYYQAAAEMNIGIA
jgi:hypothetical protein